MHTQRVADAYVPVQGARLEAEQMLSGVTQIAGIGGIGQVKIDQKARGDRISWLNANNMSEGPLRMAVDALGSLKQSKISSTLCHLFLVMSIVMNRLS